MFNYLFARGAVHIFIQMTICANSIITIKQRLRNLIMDTSHCNISKSVTQKPLAKNAVRKLKGRWPMLARGIWQVSVTIMALFISEFGNCPVLHKG